ncbi:MAG: AI-2E family transporter [Planctomycetota bacterium]|jgi:predicted PurR-regulated permease PerM
MTEPDNRYTFDRVVRMVLSALVLIGVFLLIRFLADVLIPFAIAIVLAYMINPLVNAFERKLKRRGLAVAISLSLLAVLGMASIAILLPLAVNQAGRFGRDWTKLQRDLSAYQLDPEAETKADDGGEEGAKTLLGWAELGQAMTEIGRIPASDAPRSEHFRRAHEMLRGTYIGDWVDYTIGYLRSEDFKAKIIGMGNSLSAGVWSMFASALNFLLALAGLVIVLLYVVFLLLDFPEYARNWKSFLPPKYREGIVEFLAEFDVALRRYFRGQAFVAMAMAAIFCVGFSLIKLPMAIPLGLFIGLLNMVPYLQAVGLIPAMLFCVLRALETDSTFGMSVFLTLLVFALAQLIQDALIVPRIMGQATGLKPLAILLGIFIWGRLLGFLGVLLAIPLTCLGIAYYRRFILKHSVAETQITEET